MAGKRQFLGTKEENKKAFEDFKNDFYEGNIITDQVSKLLDKSIYDESDDAPKNWRFTQNNKKSDINWQRITNLPTGIIGDSDLYRSNERMQNLLCGEHTLQHRLAFLMLRQNKYTGLYFGASSEKGGNQVPIQLRENIQLNLMGARMEFVPDDYYNGIEYKLDKLPYCGVITGQPSLRLDEKENPIQSLDRLTSGIINFEDGKERDYALLVISQPINDTETKNIIKRMQNIKSSLHEFAAYNESRGISEGSNYGKSTGGNLSFSGGVFGLVMTAAGILSGGGVLGGILAAGAAVGALGQVGNQASGITGSLNLGISKSIFSSESTGHSNNVTKEHINYTVKYCEDLLDKAVKRLEQGRNLGFWNTGIYVLGDSPETVDLVMAELRSVYAGENTYQEPIRTFNFYNSQDVRYYIDSCQLLPLPQTADSFEETKMIRESAAENSEDGSWHSFGEVYQYMSTPMNTQELSIVMSLPKKDVAGIHIKRDAVEFATNPPKASKNIRSIDLGKILDMGASTNHSYYLDIDQLNRHGLIVGLNGGGKSVTSKSILAGMIKNKIPFMIIDPVKTDYALWADEYNRMHKNDPDFKPIKIIAPGLKSLSGVETKLFPLKMNPFKPCAAKGAKLDMQGHIGSLLGLLNKTMAMGDFLPMLLEEAIFDFIEIQLHGDYAERSDVDFDEIKDTDYPKLSGLIDEGGVLDRILEERHYSKENTDNFRAAITTRINSLTRGWKKDFFEADISTPPEELFESNVVICLAGVTNNSDKSFFMSLLLNAASEYRISRYQYDEEYRNTVIEGRKKYNGNYLAHYTVVEEAHRILQVPNAISSDADPQAAAAEKFCEMLSEIREPGEGLMIIDQYPSRLIADSIKNTNLKIIHRLQAADDREAMAGCMSLNPTQSMLLASLKKGDAVINSEQDDAAMWLHINMIKAKDI